MSITGAAQSGVGVGRHAALDSAGESAIPTKILTAKIAKLFREVRKVSYPQSAYPKVSGLFSSTMSVCYHMPT